MISIYDGCSCICCLCYHTSVVEKVQCAECDSVSRMSAGVIESALWLQKIVL